MVGVVSGIGYERQNLTCFGAQNYDGTARRIRSNVRKRLFNHLIKRPLKLKVEREGYVPASLSIGVINLLPAEVVLQPATAAAEV